MLAILGNFELFGQFCAIWINSGHFKQFWATLDNFRQIWAFWGNSGQFWVLGQIWRILGNFGHVDDSDDYDDDYGDDDDDDDIYEKSLSVLPSLAKFSLALVSSTSAPRSNTFY